MDRIVVGERLIVIDSPEVFTKERVRSDKKVRVNTALDQITYDLLFELSAKCRTKPTTLANQLLYAFVRNADFIQYIQDRYEVPLNDRLVPFRDNGTTTFVKSPQIPRMQKPVERSRKQLRKQY